MTDKEVFEFVETSSSIEEMRIRINSLEKEQRQAVVLFAMKRSKYWHIWDYFADGCNIPQEKRPPLKN